MRYYSINIPGAPGSFPGRYAGGAIWGTEYNGRYDPGAQQIEFHIEEWRPDLPSAESTLTVHGVSFQQIKDTGYLIGKPIIIYGGMRKGLPLATAQSSKAGLLLQGQILRAWGNWVGTEMSIGFTFAPAGVSKGDPKSGSSQAITQAIQGAQQAVQGLTGGSQQSVRSRRVGARSLDSRSFARGAVAPLGGDQPVVIPMDIGDIGELPQVALGAATSFSGGMASSFFGGGGRGLEAPLNLIHNMMPNMPMSSAIQDTLSKALPNANVNMNISQGLKVPYQDAGMYQNMQQYAGFIKNLSSSILGIKDYLGVNMSAKSNTINVWDGTHPIGEGIISVIDLIGQPTWIDYLKINIKTILRGDITCGMRVTLPDTLIALTPDAIIPTIQADQRTHVSLPGSFIVTRILHIGDFRNPDGVGWSSNFECIYEGATTGQNAANQSVTNSSAAQNSTNQPTSDQPPTTPGDEGIVEGQ